MTSPPQATTLPRGMRVYHWPPSPPHELKVVGVTSVISNGIPKGFLGPWSAKMVAEYAVDNLKSWAPLAEADPKAAIDMLKRAPYRSTSEKADMGTIVHAAIEHYLKHDKVMTEAEMKDMLTEARVPLNRWSATKKYVLGALEFLYDFEPEILHSEATVYSREHGYAGTSDIIAGKIRVGKSRVPAIADFKTGKAIYDETSLQLCAYSRTDFVGHADGTEEKMLEDIRHGLAVRLTPSGKYDAVPFTLGDDLFDVFLAAKTVALGAEVMRQARGVAA